MDNAIHFVNQPWFTNIFLPQINILDGVPPYSTTPSMKLALPILLVVWLAAFGAVIVARRRTDLGQEVWRSFTGISLASIPLLILLLSDKLWQHVPRVLTYIQFAYRLNTYVVLCLAGLTIVSLKALSTHGISRRPNSWRGALLVVLAVGLGLGVTQVWSSESSLKTREDAITPRGIAPPSWNDGGSFNDASAPMLTVGAERRVVLDPSGEIRGHYRALVDIPEGPDPISTNIATGTYLVRISGVVPVGRSICATCDRYTMVVKRPPDRLTGPVVIQIDTASTWSIRVGRWISVICLLIAGAWTAAIGARGIRQRRSVSVAGIPDDGHDGRTSGR